MSVQAKSYIEDMKRMYEIITKKENLSLIELSFLDIYIKTIEGTNNEQRLNCNKWRNRRVT